MDILQAKALEKEVVDIVNGQVGARGEGAQFKCYELNEYVKGHFKAVRESLSLTTEELENIKTPKDYFLTIFGEVDEAKRLKDEAKKAGRATGNNPPKYNCMLSNASQYATNNGLNNRPGKEKEVVTEFGKLEKRLVKDVDGFTIEQLNALEAIIVKARITKADIQAKIDAEEKIKRDAIIAEYEANREFKKAA